MGTDIVQPGSEAFIPFGFELGNRVNRIPPADRSCFRMVISFQPFTLPYPPNPMTPYDYSQPYALTTQKQTPGVSNADTMITNLFVMKWQSAICKTAHKLA